MYKIAIVGLGRVGMTLAIALGKAGHTIKFGVGRARSAGDGAGHQPPPRVTSTEQKTFAINIPVYALDNTASLCAELATVDVVLIATTDRAIPEVAQHLAKMDGLRPHSAVLHTAGALTHEVLHPFLQYGVAIGSLHPLQTIADASTGAASLAGSYFAIEGQARALEIARDLVRDMAGQAIHLNASDRPRYHAAAVLASNAITALASVAVEVLGTPDALQALLPLMEGALRNLRQQGLPQALTGPIERGDVATIRAHLTALQNNPTASSVYTALGLATVRLACQKGSLTKVERDELWTCLSHSDNTRT